MWKISTSQDEFPGPYTHVSVERDGHKTKFMVNKESLFELALLINVANKADGYLGSFKFWDNDEDKEYDEL